MEINAYLYRKLIPDYWFEVEENPQNYDECDQYLDGRIKSIPKGKSFIFFADPHLFKGETRPLTPTNAMQSPAIIGYIRAMTGIKTVINGGDVVNRASDKYKGLQEHLILNNEMVAVAGKDYLVVPGNHDLNAVNVKPEGGDVGKYLISYEETEKKLFSHIDRQCEDEERVKGKLDALGATPEQKKEFLAYTRLHYYVDDDELKMRYIVLDAGNQDGGRNGVVEELFNISHTKELVLQYDWLYETLMSVPEDYDVAVLSHCFVGYADNFSITTNILGICKIVSGYRSKTKVTVGNPLSDNEKLACYYAAGNHEYDFTGRKGNGTVVLVGADKHLDVQAKADYDENGNFVSSPYIPGEKLSDTAVVVNIVQTDCYSNQSRKYPEINNEMTPGTKTEQCFDVVTICPDGNVRFTRIGAGKGREVKYN